MGDRYYKEGDPDHYLSSDPGRPRKTDLSQFAQQGPTLGYDEFLWTNVAQPSAYEYGQEPGTAAKEEQRYADMAHQADFRQGAQIDNSNYYGDRGMELGARGSQSYGLAKYLDLAEGRGPSAATAAYNQAVAQGNAQQASIAASARGGGANLVAAQQAGANAAANMTGQAAGSYATAKAQEQIAALGGFSNLASQARAQDLQREGLSADQAYKQAQLEQQQHTLNDARNITYEQMRQNVFENQNANRQAGEAMNQGNYLGTSALGQQRAQADRDWYTKLAAGGMQALGSAMGSDVRLKKDIKPGAARTEAALDAMHGMAPVAQRDIASGAVRAMPGQEIPDPTFERQRFQYEDRAAPQQFRPVSHKVMARHPVGGSDVAGRTEVPRANRYEQEAWEYAALPYEEKYGPPAASGGRRPIGPTPTGQEIAQGLLGPRQIPYYGPTPTGEEIAGQYLPAPQGALPAPQVPAQLPAPQRGYLPVARDYLTSGAPGVLYGAANDLREMQPSGETAVTSDERAKTGTHPGDIAVQETLDHLKPYSYSYKDQSLGQGERVGIMAQDLEKSPMGLSSVIETPRGKAIDVNRGLSLALAADADLHARVKALEAKRGMR